jgi:2-polyprenyl-3-methyl-5-hydroxy-6-metoxy-1,4-benzoquinol methylase
MNNFQQEVSRIKQVYAQRDAKGKPALYQWWRKDITLTNFTFRLVVSSMLWEDLSDKQILDIGCGAGGWLRTLQEWGGEPEHLHGIDLLEDRIAQAKKMSPQIDYQAISGWPIPFTEQSMDLVTANTVFSSILDPEARLGLAKEMMRVVRSKILIYDFRISHPKNPDTIGIRKNEIRRLFPNFKIQMQTLTLAPPIQRKLAPLSPLLAYACEVLLPFLRTHAIYLLTRK